MPTPIQTGRLPRRYKTPTDDRNNPIPDSLLMEDGSFITNPEWEASQYEETFFVNGKQLPPSTIYDAVRETRKEKQTTQMTTHELATALLKEPNVPIHIEGWTSSNIAIAPIDEVESEDEQDNAKPARILVNADYYKPQ